MVELHDIVGKSIGTGIASFGLSTLVQHFNNQTWYDAATSEKTIYASLIAAGATVVYAALEKVLYTPKKEATHQK